MAYTPDTGDFKVSRSDIFTVDPRGLVVDWRNNLSRQGQEPPVDDSLKSLALDMMPRRGASDTAEGSSGQLNPIICRRLPDRKLEVIGGFRRLRAALWLIESGTCPDFQIKYTVSTMNPAEAALANLSENIQRQDLTPVELAHAVRMLHEDYHMSYDDIATRLKHTKNWLSTVVNLTSLDKEIQQSIQDGDTPVTAGLVLAKEPTPEAQREVFKAAKGDGTKKVTVEAVKEASRKRQEAKGDAAPDTGPHPRTAKNMKAFLEEMTGPLDNPEGRNLAKTLIGFLGGTKSELQAKNAWYKQFPVPEQTEQAEKTEKAEKTPKVAAAKKKVV